MTIALLLGCLLDFLIPSRALVREAVDTVRDISREAQDAIREAYRQGYRDGAAARRRMED